MKGSKSNTRLHFIMAATAGKLLITWKEDKYDVNAVSPRNSVKALTRLSSLNAEVSTRSTVLYASTPTHCIAGKHTQSSSYPWNKVLNQQHETQATQTVCCHALADLSEPTAAT